MYASTPVCLCVSCIFALAAAITVCPGFDSAMSQLTGYSLQFTNSLLVTAHTLQLTGYSLQFTNNLLATAHTLQLTGYSSQLSGDAHAVY